MTEKGMWAKMRALVRRSKTGNILKIVNTKMQELKGLKSDCSVRSTIKAQEKQNKRAKFNASRGGPGSSFM